MTGTAFNANHLLFLLQGAGWTAILSLIAFVGGGLCAFLVARARVSPHRWGRTAAGPGVRGGGGRGCGGGGGSLAGKPAAVQHARPAGPAAAADAR